MLDVSAEAVGASLVIGDTDSLALASGAPAVFDAGTELVALAVGSAPLPLGIVALGWVIPVCVAVEAVCVAVIVVVELGAELEFGAMGIDAEDAVLSVAMLTAPSPVFVSLLASAHAGMSCAKITDAKTNLVTGRIGPLHAL